MAIDDVKIKADNALEAFVSALKEIAYDFEWENHIGTANKNAAEKVLEEMKLVIDSDYLGDFKHFITRTQEQIEEQKANKEEAEFEKQVRSDYFNHQMGD